MTDIYIITAHTNEQDPSAWVACGYQELIDIINQVVIEEWGIKNPMKIPSKEKIQEDITKNGISGYTPDTDGGFAHEYFLIWKLSEARVDTMYWSTFRHYNQCK